MVGDVCVWLMVVCCGVTRGGQKDQQRETAGPSSRDDEQPGPSCRRRERQPSMSETNPLYTFCKEDLDSMDKEVRNTHAYILPTKHFSKM